LVVISIACIDLRDGGTSLGPLGTLMSVRGSLASAEVWNTLPQLLYLTVCNRSLVRPNAPMGGGMLRSQNAPSHPPC
jgi:hypothetical protein